MIRFVDSEKIEIDYQKACDFDSVFGSINAFLYKKSLKNNSDFFWTIYSEDDELLGNLSFVNDTFTVCVKNDFCAEELAQFIDFWGNFASISYNICNVTSLYEHLSLPCISACGKVLSKKCDNRTKDIPINICKDINLYSVFCLFKDSFPEKLENVSFDNFNYDMNSRIRKGQSILYGVVLDGVLASALEIMCTYKENIILGCLATDKEQRSKGLASSLLNFVSNDFSNSTLFVFAENDTISRFYKKLGFEDYAVWAELTPARKD